MDSREAVTGVEVTTASAVEVGGISAGEMVAGVTTSAVAAVWTEVAEEDPEDRVGADQVELTSTIAAVEVAVVVRPNEVEAHRVPTDP